VTDVQIGRILRALRLRKRLRQIDVAASAGVSQSTISLVERGHCDRLALSALRRVFAGVEARLELIATWRGAEIDRLIDEDHARLVAVIVGLLRRFGWITEVEVTYSRYRERGSIDVFAGHEVSRSVLVVEVKTAIGGTEATGRKLDEKTRLAAVLAEDRFGWRPRAVGRFARAAGDDDGTPTSPTAHCRRSRIGPRPRRRHQGLAT
jgi:transcriptional regulator with XRE-family HTH domain